MVEVGGLPVNYWHYSPQTSTQIVATYLREKGVPRWAIRAVLRWGKATPHLRFTPSIRDADAKLDWSVPSGVSSGDVGTASSHETPGGDDSIRCPPVC
jgi:hypothetical protein